MPHDQNKPHDVVRKHYPQPDPNADPSIGQQFDSLSSDQVNQQAVAQPSEPDPNAGFPAVAPSGVIPDEDQASYVSRDASTLIPTGAIPLDADGNPIPASEPVLSPELEADPDNPRIHGKHHHKHGGRPLESVASDFNPEADAQRQAQSDAGTATGTDADNPVVGSQTHTQRDPRDHGHDGPTDEERRERGVVPS
jgi:hypothetical protein